MVHETSDCHEPPSQETGTQPSVESKHKTSDPELPELSVTEIPFTTRLFPFQPSPYESDIVIFKVSPVTQFPSQSYPGVGPSPPQSPHSSIS